MGDNDFPSVMPNWGAAKGKALQWRESGMQRIAGGPSFDMTPDIDSPAVDRWIQDIRNAPGYKPPTFLSPQEMRRRVLELDRQMRMRV